MFGLRKLQTDHTNPACWTDLKRKQGDQLKGIAAVRTNKVNFYSDMLQTSRALQYRTEIPVTFLHIVFGPTFSCAAVPRACVAKSCITSNASVMDWREGGLQVRSFCALQTL